MIKISVIATSTIITSIFPKLLKSSANLAIACLCLELFQTTRYMSSLPLKSLHYLHTSLVLVYFRYYGLPLIQCLYIFWQNQLLPGYNYHMYHVSSSVNNLILPVAFVLFPS